MKRILVYLVFFLFIINSFFSLASSESLCIKDSDGGKNYYVRGSLSVNCGGHGGGCGAWIDSCKDETTVLEYYCDGDNLNDNFVLYDCPYGCADGACKNGPTDDPVCGDGICEKNEKEKICPQAEPIHDSNQALPTICHYRCPEDCGETTFPVCDATTPCPEGLECYKFPSEGLKCAEPNPCSYYDCPDGKECIVAESYPMQVICSGTSNESVGNAISYNIKEKKEYIIINKNQETQVSISEATSGNQGIFLESKTLTIPSSKNLVVENEKLYMQTSNGMNTEIKVMPETASKKAIEKLGEINFNVELKEVGSGNEFKPTYEFSGEKESRFLGLFKIKAKVMTQVNAENGEIVATKKPWWSFLASGI